MVNKLTQVGIWYFLSNSTLKSFLLNLYLSSANPPKRANAGASRNTA